MAEHSAAKPGSHRQFYVEVTLWRQEARKEVKEWETGCDGRSVKSPWGRKIGLLFHRVQKFNVASFIWKQRMFRKRSTWSLDVKWWISKQFEWEKFEWKFFGNFKMLFWKQSLRFRFDSNQTIPTLELAMSDFKNFEEKWKTTFEDS